MRLDITDAKEVQQFLAIPSDKTPVLYKKSDIHHSRFDSQMFASVVKEHLDFAQILADAGIKKIAIATDDDGMLHQILSPRFSSLDLATRAKPLLDIYLGLKAKFEEVVVWLLVEELAPGGLDATDGVSLAKMLEDLGLKHVVACSGTKDFPPLYFRKATKEKNEEIVSTEPALASSLWLLNNTDLKVSSVAFIEDPKVACALAKSLGIFSVIEKTV